MDNSIEKQIRALVIFRNLRKDPLVQMLLDLIDEKGTAEEKIDRYASFTAKLFERTSNLTSYILDRVLIDENIYVHALAAGNADFYETCLSQELDTLERLSKLSASDVREHIGYDGYLPEWTTTMIDFKTTYSKRMAQLPTLGYGIYADYPVLCVKNEEIVPVKWPDTISLSDFSGYENQRNAVIQNTLAFLEGKPAANALLYGDAGTGKSSTVKAIVNAYSIKGLRLIEVSKRQLHSIPAVIESLSINPLKFILFFDDLSFSHENDDFYALKAILEGSVYSKSNNTIIYATSNRRHMIKENFADRNTDEVHRNETIQELASLSDRFGLKVGFFEPNKNDYLKIVQSLADQNNLDIDRDILALKAEQFALSGRSARVARQFIDYMISLKK